MRVIPSASAGPRPNAGMTRARLKLKAGRQFDFASDELKD